MYRCAAAIALAAAMLTPAAAAPPAQAEARRDAARFLAQATFGPTLAEIETLAASPDYGAWLERQRGATICLEMPRLLQRGGTLTQDHRVEAWLHCAVRGEDQLRQRMAFALSEIFVVSEWPSTLAPRVHALAWYYDLLAQQALGNFRELLEAVTLSPAMAHYLNFVRNAKGDAASGTRADENYARELMQLFTIGLHQLNPDGTPQLDARGAPIATYTQTHVEGLARVLTGWGMPGGFANTTAHWQQFLVPYESYHDRGAKTLPGGVEFAAGVYARDELERALDLLFAHPNVGPFIGRQLIQRLVTSDPAPDYVARVARVFANNGAGVRGDLYAVCRAILLDPAARAPDPADAAFGKLREPLLRLTQLWRGFDARAAGAYLDAPQLEATLTQAPLRAPSVFNFFKPGHTLTSVIGNGAVNAPEFQAANESSITLATNFLQLQAQRFRDADGTLSVGTPADAITIDLGPWTSRARHPARVLDDLDLQLMAGQMPAAMRQPILDHLSAIPGDWALYRVSEAIQLIMAAPQAGIQR